MSERLRHAQVREADTSGSDAALGTYGALVNRKHHQTDDAVAIHSPYDDELVAVVHRAGPDLIVNDVSTFRVDHMPYGGVKDSGFGREGLRYAIEEMTEMKLLAYSRRTTG